MISKDPKKWEHKKTREELYEALDRQLANLRRSFLAFDDGAVEEAERIASGIYILCHDGINSSKSKSLLGMLGLKQNLLVPDSTPVNDDPSVATSGPPLIAFRVNEDGTVQYVRAGDAFMNNQYKPFAKWWEGTVYNNERGLALSRKNLVFSIRSQDGGAHVDDSLRDHSYYRFLKFRDHVSTNEKRTLTINMNHEFLNVELIPHLTIRQIGAELWHAIQRLNLPAARTTLREGEQTA